MQHFLTGARLENRHHKDSDNTVQPNALIFQGSRSHEQERVRERRWYTSKVFKIGYKHFFVFVAKISRTFSQGYHINPLPRLLSYQIGRRSQPERPIKWFYCVDISIWPKKYICVQGYPTVPKYFIQISPTLIVLFLFFDEKT